MTVFHIQKEKQQLNTYIDGYHPATKYFKETNHDHFLSCSLSEIQQSAKIGTLTKTLHSLKTTTTIINLITSGINTYYNNNTKEFSNKEDILITKQQEIEWNNFARDWESSEFIKRITKHYKSKHIT